jgi:hypothetical protein
MRLTWAGGNGMVWNGAALDISGNGLELAGQGVKGWPACA